MSSHGYPCSFTTLAVATESRRAPRSTMKCAGCQHENVAGARFCEECAAPLARECENCGAPLSLTAKFCSQCAHPSGREAQATAPRFGTPDVYTPRHLVEKILMSKTALEGER